MKNKGIREMVFLFAACCAVSAAADSVIIGERDYDHVYIRVSASRIYLQLPTSGGTISFKKEEVAPGSLHYSSELARTDLLRQWNSKHKKVTDDVLPAPLPLQPRPHDDTLAPLRLKGNVTPSQAPAQSSVRIPYIKLRDIPLREALPATLRPLGLDYRIINNIIYVSTAEALRTEPFAPTETRFYEVANDGDTLPKIVLHAGFGVINANATGTGSNGGVANMGTSGSFGGAQFRGSAGSNAPGIQNGVSGGSSPQGLGRNDVTQISNISDLFSTIDDRLVGETPATVGIGFSKSNP